ncbi:MAG: hypothetical protein WBA92_05260 [Pseudorhodobacter sp.]
MSSGLVILLGVQGLVFVFWTIQMFRCLFRLRARAVAETGQSIPGLAATLRSFRAFLTEDIFRRDRIILAALTILLFALIGAVATLASGQAQR